MGVRHEVLLVPAPPGEDEPRLPGESPEDYVCRTAREKAQGNVMQICISRAKGARLVLDL